MVQCSMLKVLELTAEEVLRRKAVRIIVKPLDAEQQTAVPTHYSIMRCHEM